tara:strand:+ start:913 stop:1095 length:183 start_codon:yes stop_codon:yes gene_type:complete
MRYEINGDNLTIWGSLSNYGVQGMTLEVDRYKRARREESDAKIRQYFQEHQRLPDNPETL